MKLGKLEMIDDLRSVWKNEERDFSKWLAQKENLNQLGEEVGIDIELEQTESAVGKFSVDIYASEIGSNRKIIIENQLEKTDHDHLGKLITYASGKGADIIIWIVKKAQEEHRNAIDWLNEHTVENIGFFLVEIQLYRIGDSLVAPKFNVVERPNDWAKAMKSASTSEGGVLRLDYWQAYNDAAEQDTEYMRLFSIRKPSKDSWRDIALGTSVYWICLTLDTQKKQLSCGIYIGDSFEAYEHFESQKDEIEQIVGLPVAFSKASKSSRFRCFKDNIDVTDRSTWQEAFAWYREMAFKFREVHKKCGL